MTICNGCGQPTKKTSYIENGLQISAHECDECGYVQGKTVLNATNDYINGQIAMTAQAPKQNFLARILPDQVSKTWDKYTPPSWKKQQNIISKDITPPGSGLGYIFSPYTSLWTQMWGVTPIADLSKYRLMYRTVPKIKRGIDKTVASAVIKGFNDLEIVENFEVPQRFADMGYDKEEYGRLIINYINQWIEAQHNFNQILHMVASDMLIYGNAYVELVYEDMIEEELATESLIQYEVPRSSYDWAGRGLTEASGESPMETVKNPDGKFKLVDKKGKLLWLKPLDPLYMRVRADSYGNIFGYLQFLSVPPIAYTPDKMAHFRYSPKSWQYEIVNGTSILMSMVRTQDIIWQIENDLILLGHATVKPPIMFTCGTIEEPWSDAMYTAFKLAAATRGPGGDVFVRGDVKAVPLPAPSESMNAMVDYLGYHDTQRTISLGIPPALLGQPEGSSRTTAEVSLEDWINTLQNLQIEIGNILEAQVFKQIVEEEFGEGAPIPRPVWNELFDKNENDITSRIISMKQAGIISLNEARSWLSSLNIDMKDFENGDIIPDQEMSILQLEEQQLNIEILKNPPEVEESDEVEEKEEVQASIFPNLIQKDSHIPPVKDEDIKRCASEGMTDPGVGDGSGEDQLMYPGLPKDRKKKKVKTDE